MRDKVQHLRNIFEKKKEHLFLTLLNVTRKKKVNYLFVSCISDIFVVHPQINGLHCTQFFGDLTCPTLSVKNGRNIEVCAEDT